MEEYSWVVKMRGRGLWFQGAGGILRRVFHRRWGVIEFSLYIFVSLFSLDNIAEKIFHLMFRFQERKLEIVSSGLNVENFLSSESRFGGCSTGATGLWCNWAMFIQHVEEEVEKDR